MHIRQAYHLAKFLAWATEEEAFEESPPSASDDDITKPMRTEIDLDASIDLALDESSDSNTLD